MECMTEETFGPTLPVMKVADADEAIRLANDSPYGLQASVWTKDTERGEEIARRLESGVVCINDAQLNYVALELPMGGWKDSGRRLPPRRRRHPQVHEAADPAGHALRADQQGHPHVPVPERHEAARPRLQAALGPRQARLETGRSEWPRKGGDGINPVPWLSPPARPGRAPARTRSRAAPSGRPAGGRRPGAPAPAPRAAQPGGRWTSDGRRRREKTSRIAVTSSVRRAAQR